jgi:hypothetical protein
MLRTIQQRRGGYAGFWLLIGLLLGGAAGAGTVFFLKNKGGIPGSQRLGHVDELDLVPADSVAFVHVRAKDLWKSELLVELRKLVEKAGPEVLKLLDEEYSPAPSTLDRVTLVLLQHSSKPIGKGPQPKDMQAKKTPAIPPEPLNRVPQTPRTTIEFPSNLEPVVILTFTAPFEEVKSKSSLLPNAFEMEIGGKKYWEDTPAGLAVYFPSNTLMVLGTPAGVSQFITRLVGSEKQVEGPLTGALNLAASGKGQIVGGVNLHYFHVNLQQLKTEIESLPLNADDLTQIAKDADPLQHAEALAVCLSLMGHDDSKIEVQAYFKDDKGAEDGEKAVRTLAELTHTRLAEPRKKLEKEMKHSPDQTKPRSLQDLPETIVSLLEVGLLNRVDEYLVKPPLHRANNTLILTFELPSLDSAFISGMTASTGLMIQALLKFRELQKEKQ